MAAENSTRAARVPGRPFEKGKSGNPGGRPKKTQKEKDALAAIRSLAPDAAERLRKILDDPDAKPDILLRAIDIVLDRAYGKPRAEMDMNASITRPDFVLRILPDDGDGVDSADD